MTALARLQVVQPRTRAECADVPRPCPFAGCRYHLAELAKRGHALAETCALDVADRGPIDLEDLALLVGYSTASVGTWIAEAADALRLRGEVLGLSAPAAPPPAPAQRHTSAPPRPAGELRDLAERIERQLALGPAAPFEIARALGLHRRRDTAAVGRALYALARVGRAYQEPGNRRARWQSTAPGEAPVTIRVTDAERVLVVLERGPSTARAIAHALGIRPNAAFVALRHLNARGLVAPANHDRPRLWRLAPQETP